MQGQLCCFNIGNWIIILIGTVLYCFVQIHVLMATHRLPYLEIKIKPIIILRGMVASKYEMISLIKLCTSLYDIANLESTLKNMLGIIGAT